MVSIQRNKDGTYTDISDQIAPAPHRLTKVIEKTGNYGLADEARKIHKELALHEGEVPSAVFSRMNINSTDPNTKTIMIGRGRGRGRIYRVPVGNFMGRARGADCGAGVSQAESPEGAVARNRDETEKALRCYQNMAGLYFSGMGEDGTDDLEVFSDFHGTEEEPYVVQEIVDDVFSNYAASEVNEPTLVGSNVDPCYTMDQPTSDDVLCRDTEYEGEILSMSEPLGMSSGTSINAVKKSKGAKLNGYCMFLKHMAKRTGDTGTIDQLIRKFDKNWKALPDDEKAAWKQRAKTTGLTNMPGESSNSIRGKQTRGTKPQQRLSVYQRVEEEDDDDGY